MADNRETTFLNLGQQGFRRANQEPDVVAVSRTPWAITHPAEVRKIEEELLVTADGTVWMPQSIGQKAVDDLRYLARVAGLDDAVPADKRINALMEIIRQHLDKSHMDNAVAGKDPGE